MIHSILVPLDASPFGEHALPLAANIARRAGARLHLVHVHQFLPPAIPEGFTLLDEVGLHLRQSEKEYLASISRRLAETEPLAVETALLEGDPVRAMKDYARTNDVDLVVMSTHGRGAMGRFWLGSVANQVAREMPRPVLLVRPQEVKANLSRVVNLNTILIPSDGTSKAHRVLEPTLELARLIDSTLVLF